MTPGPPGLSLGTAAISVSFSCTCITASTAAAGAVPVPSSALPAPAPCRGTSPKTTRLTQTGTWRRDALSHIHLHATPQCCRWDG